MCVGGLGFLDKLSESHDGAENEVYFVQSNALLGRISHGISLFITLILAVSLLVNIVFLLNDIVFDVGITLYCILLLLVIILYWPGALHRLVLSILSTYGLRNYYETCDSFETTEYPPLSILVATRNEPSDLVIELLESLKLIEYPNFEIVLTDNSDALDRNNDISCEFLKLYDYINAKKLSIRFIRRALPEYDCGF